MERLGVLTIAVLLTTTGCTGGGQEEPGPAGPPTVTTEPATPAPAPSGSPAGTATAADIDCAAVEQARQDLVDATNAELDRLDVPRSDPRAFAVQVLVTGQQAAEYWTALREALPAGDADLAADVEEVVAYWSALDQDLDAIEIAAGDEASVQEATERYLQVTAATPDDAVLPAQERVTAGVDAACGGTATG